MIRIISPCVQWRSFLWCERSISDLGNLRTLECPVGKGEVGRVHRQAGEVGKGRLRRLDIEEKVPIGRNMPGLVVTDLVNCEHPQESKARLKLKNEKIARLKIL